MSQVSKDAINKLKSDKKMLELALTCAVGKILEDYEKNTGVTPDSISVNFVDTTTFGGPPSRVMSGVTVDIVI